ncbi:MAG: glycosyltransferase [Candidatus Wallbacteria bacterium]|nr:glycosyltransferase [Candidatus Wallbacteria bacterium]
MKNRLKVFFLLDWSSIHSRRWVKRHRESRRMVFRVCDTGRIRHRQDLWRLIFQIADFRPDFLHIHVLSAQTFSWLKLVYPFLRLLGIRICLTTWGSDVLCPSIGTPWFDEIRSFCRMASFITCDSLSQRDRLIKDFSVHPDKVFLVQWGIDARIFNLDSRDSFDQHGEMRVLSSRAWCPLYNIHRIVSAYRRYLADFPDEKITLSLIRFNPDSTCRLQLEKALSSEINIIQPMRQKELACLLKHTDILVSIPDSDGTSVSVLEGLASGAMVIASDLDSIRELIRLGFKLYLMNPARAEQGIPAAIHEIRNLSPEQIDAIRSCNLRLIEKFFSYQEHGLLMESLYLKCLSESVTRRRGKLT